MGLMMLDTVASWINATEWIMRDCAFRFHPWWVKCESMRTKLVVANWKMNKTIAEAAATVEAFLRLVRARADVDTCICPPFTTMIKVREQLKQSHVQLGAQDVFWKDAGAFTGHISPAMLAELGVSYCVVGHSETRGRFGKMEVSAQSLGYFAETDHTVNLKIHALLYQAINPILCVGETEEEREAGKTEDVIRAQLAGALEGLDASELYFFSVAYEPVWAIGTGKTCESGEASRVCGFIRSVLADLLDADVAQEIRILYGGSVKPENAAELFKQPDIDGGLVGGASLDAASFAKIVQAC